MCGEGAERECGNSETIREVVHRVVSCFQIEEPCLNQSMTRDTCFTSGKSNNLALIRSLAGVHLELIWSLARFRHDFARRQLVENRHKVGGVGAEFVD